MQRIFADAREEKITRRIIAEHQENGQRSSPEIAALELLNLLQTIVGVSRFIVFAAMALERHPQWRERIVGGAGDVIEAFVAEIRRPTPFLPVIGGVVREPFDWNGIGFKKREKSCLTFTELAAILAPFRRPEPSMLPAVCPGATRVISLSSKVPATCIGFIATPKNGLPQQLMGSAITRPAERGASSRLFLH